MSEKPDTTKIEAALKRAAYKALHGTREERSGRFLPKQKTIPDEHMAGVLEGLEQAQRGEFASEADADAVLHKPWR